MKAILGKKLGMTRIFNEAGKVIPVTLIWAEPNVATQIKNSDQDGYIAAQIALPENKKVKKPQAGHLAKTEIKTRFLREFAIDGLKIGDKLDVSQFVKGQIVTVCGLSKGKGFAGTVKRHNFATGPKTHGSNNYRQPGSIGPTYPQRVIKGRHMAGHMGYDRTTVKNLTIADVDLEKNILFIRGAVPGPSKGNVMVWSENE